MKICDLSDFIFFSSIQCDIKLWTQRLLNRRPPFAMQWVRQTELASKRKYLERAAVHEGIGISRDFESRCDPTPEKWSVYNVISP
jgi:hypothetical protein